MKKIKLSKKVTLLFSQLLNRTRFQSMSNIQYQAQNALIEKQQLDIDFLKKQINVHFIVNTLSVIKRLNEIGDNDKAGEMCTALAHILRYANDAQDYISLIEEIHILEMYIHIMKMKYTQSITCIYEVDSDADDLVLPRMLLQPLIENAVVHGIALKNKGTILIKAIVVEDELIITIQDNGVGMNTEALEEIRQQLSDAKYQQFSVKGIEHIALANIQRRIAFIAGMSYGLEIDSIKEEGTTIRLNLPVLHIDESGY